MSGKIMMIKIGCKTNIVMIIKAQVMLLRCKGCRANKKMIKTKWNGIM